MVVLQVHQGVELQASLDLVDGLSVSFEDVIDLVSAIELARVVGKLLAAQLLDFIKLGTLLFEFFGNATDHIINAGLGPLRVQDNQPLVLAIHLVPLVFSISWEF